MISLCLIISLTLETLISNEVKKPQLAVENFRTICLPVFFKEIIYFSENCGLYLQTQVFNLGGVYFWWEKTAIRIAGILGYLCPPEPVG